jgi:hypothetical protein
MKLHGLQFVPKLEKYKSSYTNFSISHFVHPNFRLHSNPPPKTKNKDHPSQKSPNEPEEHPFFIPNMATIKNVAITGVSTTTESHIKTTTNMYLRLPAILVQQY